ncbi:MAG TPA: BadF/BadG/BcrA/BcrD ATPase family protein [Bacteroidota bacterium]|nr:BadF/BadG/BcrA/BcrD ATPase family protein [Bacteroidota bacterium]
MNTPERSYVLGIDGGGTKTIAELCSSRGAVIATARGGASNFQVTGVATAARTICDLAETCCHSAGVPHKDVRALVAGLAGAGRTGDQERMAHGLRELFFARTFRNVRIAVESDGRIALEGAFGGEAGIAIIAGTGSLVMGKDSRGRIHRAGGWGRYLGDEGSGYTIGREGLRAVAKMIDGAGKKTVLAKRLAVEFGLGSQKAIINAVYTKGFDIASVAKLVVEAAEKGDGVATRILAEAVKELLSVTEPVWRKLRRVKRGSSVSIVFIGGLIAGKNVYSRKLQAALTKKLSGISVVVPKSQPVHGASIMALGLLSPVHARATA